MPRIKAAAAPDIAKKPKKTKKPAAKKTPASVKKIKKVVVDVIEDEATDFSTADDYLKAFTAAEKVSEEPLVMEVADEVEGHESLPFEKLDQQKQYFSKLETEMKGKRRASDQTEEENYGGRKRVSLYRRLVWKFIILVLILAGFVAYFSFSKLTIVITPKGESLDDILFLKVAGESAPASSSSLLLASSTGTGVDPREAISGQVREVSAAVENIYPASGEEAVGEDIAGQVKIINNSNKAQALVATTRLLSPDNKLYRIKEAVNVPAGGETAVEIYTDKPAVELAIGPTTFTIPGLWLGLQDKIFARSEQAFTFQQKAKKYIKQTDIEAATQDINKLLIQNAKNQLGDTGQNWLYDTSAAAAIRIDSRAGDFKDQFTIRASSTVVAVSFDKKEAAKLATAKLNLLVPDDKKLIDFNPDAVVYALDNYDLRSGVATIKASYGAGMILKDDSEIIDRNQLVNLTKDQIDNYLKDFPEIKTYELHFIPGFVKRAPNLVDRISVKIKN